LGVGRKNGENKMAFGQNVKKNLDKMATWSSLNIDKVFTWSTFLSKAIYEKKDERKEVEPNEMSMKT